ncbi:hypothetical protein ACQEV9_44325 [Streptomyces chartreusis]|uniref:hypothetical protein n=1 Tax=Streptomyces chartreusis TaxID=1969 RepID=UPI003D8E2077
MRRKQPVPRTGSPDGSATWTSAFPDRPKSSDTTLRFTAQIQVTWRRDHSLVSPVSRHAAARLIREVVDEAAAECDVLRPDAAEQDIAAAVHACLPLTGDGVVVTDARIRIIVDDATRNAALTAEQLQQDFQRRAIQLQHEYELDELARRQVRSREAFLRHEILANPASARLYTLLESSADHWPRVAAGIQPGTDLRDLVREIQQWQPGRQWVAVAQLLHEFLASLSAEGRRELLTLLIDAVQAFGADETAQRLASLASEAR